MDVKDYETLLFRHKCSLPFGTTYKIHRGSETLLVSHMVSYIILTYKNYKYFRTTPIYTEVWPWKNYVPLLTKSFFNESLIWYYDSLNKPVKIL